MSFWAPTKTAENRCQVVDRDFSFSDVALGLDDLKNPDWLEKFVKYYGSSFRGLSDPIRIAALSSISAPLTRIPYKGEPKRSKIHILYRGQHGGGKGVITSLIERHCPLVRKIGVATSAAIMGGGTKEGGWKPGEAYNARNGVLIISELFQTLRTGEHYESISLDMNELLEHPHAIVKENIGYDFKDLATLAVAWPGVKFERTKFSYSAPCAVIACVPEIPLFNLLARVSEGLMSRFIEIPIVYDRKEAEMSLENFCQNVLPEGEEDLLRMEESNVSMEEYSQRCFYMLYAANQPEWNASMRQWFEPRNISPQRGFILSRKIRSMFEEASVRALNRSLSEVEKAVSWDEDSIESVRPPILFRECEDMLRLACADSVSRRFAGTEHENGYIRIDERAAHMALGFLNMITDTAVTNMIESRKIRKLATAYKPSLLCIEYEVIKEAGFNGVPRNDFFAILEKNFKISKARAEARLKKMITNDLVEERSGVLYSTILSRLGSNFRW